MGRYYDGLSKEIKEYYKILSPEFPEWLHDYIDTKAMLKQAGISVTCGTIYSKMYDQIWYSSLDHSIAVSLIIWNFTKDKKQTLAGLFHDIATPVFKHSIDFMNQDYDKQESTEELTTKMISDSEEIMNLLKRDGIALEEVCDYHLYPIADNDTPRLASDRLEYTLSNGLGVIEKLWGLEDVKEIYEDIEIQQNEDGIQELGFRSIKVAEKFVHTMSMLSRLYRRDKTIYSMQFLADIMKKMSDEKIIIIKDMYHLSEKEIIEKIKQCDKYNIAECFKIWENATEVKTSDICPKNTYFVNIEKTKVRYINPLVRYKNGYVRLKDISETAKVDIEKTMNYKTATYTYLDFDFKSSEP